MSKYLTFLKKYRTPIIFLSFIIITNFVLGEYARSFVISTMTVGDEVFHINVADSFRNNFNFQYNVESSSTYNTNADQLISSNFKLPNELNSKGPLFYVLLAGIYALLKSEVQNFFLHGSYLNNIFSTTFLIMFFFLVKRWTNFPIAALSTIVIMFNPFFVWLSYRVLLYPLLLLVSISALFFLEKRKSHYLLFGLFVGLAHLTHPFGIFLGVSYGIFLLVKKEFKGFLIFFLTWQVILIPWFLRNYYYFKQIGGGLYLPFSSKISTYLTFLPSVADKQSSFSFLVPSREMEYLFTDFFVLQFFQRVLTFFSRSYAIEYLAIFLLLCSGIIFFKREAIKQNPLLIIFSISYVVAIYAVFYNSESSYVHYVLAFVLPIILVVLVKLRTNYIENNIPRLFPFIILLGFVSVLGYFYDGIFHSRLGVTPPDPKLMMFGLFMLVPIAILGLSKIFQSIDLSQPIVLKPTTIILVIIILSPLVFYMISAIPPKFELAELKYPQQTPEILLFNEYIRQNIETDSIIISNFPGETSLRSGLTSFMLPPIETRQNSFENYLKYFNIDYIIFYDIKNFPRSETFKQMFHWYSEDFKYEIVKKIGDSYIFKVKDVSNITSIEYPVRYSQYAFEQEKSGNLIESEPILKRITNMDSAGPLSILLCNVARDNSQSSFSLPLCENPFSRNSENAHVRSNMILILLEQGNYERTDNLFKWFENKLVYSKIIPIWSNLLNEMIETDSYSLKYGEEMIEKTQYFFSAGDIATAFVISDLLAQIDYYEDESFDIQINILQSTDADEDIIVDVFSHRAKSISSQQESLLNLNIDERYNKENTFKDDLIQAAEFAISENKFNKADNFLNQVIGFDKFDSKVWEKKGFVLEKLEKFDQAIVAYEKAYQLNSDEQLLDKIGELKNILNP